MLNRIPFQAMLAGLVAVVVGYSSAIAIVVDAARSAGANQEQMVSWLFALGIGMGLSSIMLSAYYKKPLMIAWSTPGAALLITATNGFSLSDCIAAFICASVLTIIVSILGWVRRFMAIFPTSLTSAMLAGILVQFGISIFTAIESLHFPIIAMIGVYFIAQRLNPKFSVLAVLLVIILEATFLQESDWSQVNLAISTPVLMTPTFSWAGFISLAFPLFLVTMTSQNLPGLAILSHHRYKINENKIIGWTGVTNLIFAPLGGFAFNLAAITAAICMDSSVHPNKNKRYIASIFSGVFYLITGLFATSVVTLFALFPESSVKVLAGLALLPIIQSSFSKMSESGEVNLAALITFLVTASGLTIFGVGSTVWGLALGTLIHPWFSQKQETMNTKPHE